MYAMLPIMTVAATQPDTTTLTGFVAQLYSVFTASVLPAMGDIGTEIISNPFLSFTVVFLFAGGIIGLFGRILSRG